jgi:hypothetical protein
MVVTSLHCPDKWRTFRQDRSHVDDLGTRLSLLGCSTTFSIDCDCLPVSLPWTWTCKPYPLFFFRWQFVIYTRLPSITTNRVQLKNLTFPNGFVQLDTLCLVLVTCVKLFFSVPTSAQSSITAEITMVVSRDQYEDVIFGCNWFNVCSLANNSAVTHLSNSEQKIYFPGSPQLVR